MAITARFAADFESFYAAVQKAEVNLRSFETGAAKVETSLTRMSNSLSGTRLIQDANLMVEAVHRVGGVATLTAAEQAKVNAKVTEAIAKYQALGQTAPPGMLALAEATKRVDSATATATANVLNWRSALTSVAGALGVTFSVGAILNFTKSVFTAASTIHDLSLKMGISAEAAQRFKFAAEQSGTSLETVGTAINYMNKVLAEGDKSTVAALEAAGLSFADLRRMRPEEAFAAITKAIQGMDDPMLQANVTMKLLGRSATEILPGIKEGFLDVAASATVMSEETIRRLEAAQDAWEALGAKVTIVTGEIIAGTMTAVQEVTSSWSKFAGFVQTWMTSGGGIAIATATLAGSAAQIGKDIELSTTRTATGLKTFSESADKAKVSGVELTKALGPIAHTMDLSFASTWEVIRAVEAFDEHAQATRYTLQGLNAEGLIPVTQSFAGMTAKVPAATSALKMIEAQALSLAGFLKTQLGPAILAAIQGGGNIGASIGGTIGGFLGGATSKIGASIASSLTKALGSTIGGAIGSIVPGLGTLLGGAIGGLFGKLFGKSEFQKAAEEADANIRALHTSMIAAYGSEQNLTAELQRYGLNSEGIWGNRGVGGLQYLTKLFEELSLKTSEAATKRKAELDAAVAAADAHRAQLDTIKNALKGLDDELAATNASEAPEEIMGVIETQARARIAAERRVLEEKLANEQTEQDALDEKVKTLEEDLPAAAARGVEAINRHFKEIDPLHIQVEYSTPAGGGRVPGFAAGSGGWQNFGAGQLAVLHGVERVQTPAQARTEGPMTIRVPVFLRGRQIAEAIAEISRDYGVA